MWDVYKPIIQSVIPDFDLEGVFWFAYLSYL
jgi:hypothetical protein